MVSQLRKDPTQELELLSMIMLCKGNYAECDLIMPSGFHAMDPTLELDLLLLAMMPTVCSARLTIQCVLAAILEVVGT
jgi:hypothetical protein